MAGDHQHKHRHFHLPRIPLSRKQRLYVTLSVSFSFFLAELVMGFKTRSLALIADAIHYLNDLIGFAIALTAILISERKNSPQALSFGWQRATLLGSFFNGVFLLALGVGIIFQAIERFLEVKEVHDPIIVLIVGAIGLFLNVVVLGVLHDHDHDHGHAEVDAEGHAHDHGHAHEHAHEHAGADAALESGLEVHSLHSIHPAHHEHRHTVGLNIAKPGRDLGMLGVITHVIGDAINNIGVIIAAVAIWKSDSEARFYADPAVSLFIALMIILTAIPVIKRSGHILLQSAPNGLSMEDVRHDLEKIPGVESVHELHVWRLDQKKAIASVHVVVSDKSVSNFMDQAKTINECLHAYGIHSVTLQPELVRPAPTDLTLSTDGAHDEASPVATPVSCSNPTVATEAITTSSNAVRAASPFRRRVTAAGCQMNCGSVCEKLMCCTTLS